MTMTGWQPQRPARSPGTPQDDAADDAPRQVTGDGVAAAAGLAPARARRAAAAARRPAHLAGGVGPALAPGPRPDPRRDRRRRSPWSRGWPGHGGTGGHAARQPAQTACSRGSCSCRRGGAGRRGVGRVGYRRRRVRPARPAGPVAVPGVPGRGRRRVLVAAPPPGGPRRPRPPRPGRRRAGRTRRGGTRSCPGSGWAVGMCRAAGHQPGRGTADHHLPGERPGHPDRGQQQRDRRETRAHPRPALRPDRHRPPPTTPAS